MIYFRIYHVQEFCGFLRMVSSGVLVWLLWAICASIRPAMIESKKTGAPVPVTQKSAATAMAHLPFLTRVEFWNFGMSRRPARCTQADIARAIRAVEQTGGRMAVEILPDGTIRIAPQAVDKALSRIEPERDVVL